MVTRFKKDDIVAQANLDKALKKVGDFKVKFWKVVTAQANMEKELEKANQQLQELRTTKKDVVALDRQLQRKNDDFT